MDMAVRDSRITMAGRHRQRSQEDLDPDTLNTTHHRSSLAEGSGPLHGWIHEALRAIAIGFHVTTTPNLLHLTLALQLQQPMETRIKMPL